MIGRQFHVIPLKTHVARMGRVGMLVVLLVLPAVTSRAASLANAIGQVQPRMVKIHGAGGLRGLESYQSGFLVSEEGHVLTVWSYVLDTDYITVTLHDGRKFEAQLLGHDPRIEIALLKVDAIDLSCFALDEAVELTVGDRVLAFSNLFGVAVGDEPNSVMHGHVSAITQLTGRRGAFQTPYDGRVYVVDAMTNNPGAAGGALTDRQGRLVGVLGKELRNSLNNTWLNYAIPIAELRGSVDDIRVGKLAPRSDDAPRHKPLEPVTLAMFGITLVPDVLEKTPPFIDRVRTDSPADRAGLKADDLILFVNERIASSCKNVAEELSFTDRDDDVRLTIQRGQELIDVAIRVTD